MNRVLNLLFATLFAMNSIVASAGGKIQNEDVKSLSDITSAVLITTGNLSSGSACIASPASTSGVAAGQFVYDTTTSTNIPSGTTVLGIGTSPCSSGQIKMSANAAGTATGDTITFGGQLSQLINDSKIYITANSINSQLSTAITNGLIGGAGGSKNYLANGVIASNGSGSPNPGNGDFEKNSTSGWSLAHSAISSNIPTSVASAGSAFSASSGGSAANGNLSLTIVSSGQIQKNYSGNYASSASSVAGDMLISNQFFIDTEDQAKMETIKFSYKLNSGSANTNFSGTSSNSFSIWIYDVTNGAWIQPQGVYNFTQNSGVGTALATFQTTSNSTGYQLAIVNNTASSGAFSLYVDDFNVGPQYATGVVPQAETITVLSGTGTYTPPTNTYALEVEVVGSGGGGGASQATAAGQASTGGGGGGGGYAKKVIDLSTVGATSFSYNVAGTTSGGSTGSGSSFSGGSVTISVNGGGAGAGASCATSGGPLFCSGAGGSGGTASGGDLNVQGGQGSPGIILTAGQFSAGAGGNSFFGMGSQAGENTGGGTGKAGQNYGTGGDGGAAGASSSAQAGGTGGPGTIIIHEKYRGKNVAMSADTDTRVTAFLVQGSSTSIVSSGFTTITWSSGATTDTHVGYNGTTTYTIPVSGYYDLDFTGAINIPAAAGAATFVGQFVKNGSTVISQCSSFINSNVGSGNASPFNCLLHGYLFKAGDTLIVQAQTNNSIASTTMSSPIWSVARKTGPAVVAATETVAAFAQSTATTSLTTNTFITPAFNAAIKDTHNAFNTSTGVFTAPVSGSYTACATTTVAPSVAAQLVDLAISVGGNSNIIRVQNVSAGTGVSPSQCFSAPMTAGQTAFMQLRCTFGSGTCALTTGLNQSASFEIWRVGN